MNAPSPPSSELGRRVRRSSSAFIACSAFQSRRGPVPFYDVTKGADSPPPSALGFIPSCATTSGAHVQSPMKQNPQPSVITAGGCKHRANYFLIALSSKTYSRCDRRVGGLNPAPSQWWSVGPQISCHASVSRSHHHHQCERIMGLKNVLHESSST